MSRSNNPSQLWADLNLGNDNFAALHPRMEIYSIQDEAAAEKLFGSAAFLSHPGKAGRNGVER